MKNNIYIKSNTLESNKQKTEISGAVKCLARFLDGQSINNHTKICFMNAVNYRELTGIPAEWTMQQYFKHDFEALKKSEKNTIPLLSPHDTNNKNFDYVIINAPKQALEIKYTIAAAVDALKEGGTIAIAAENNNGGGRLENLFKEIGLTCESDTKFKSRVVSATKDTPAISMETLHQWHEFGELQPIESSKSIFSIPGLFSWSRFDKGSEILLSCLPSVLSGRGADFCCGYGYLSLDLLNTSKSYSKIKSIACIDADFRAVEACRHNLNNYSGDIETECIWDDITDHNFPSRLPSKLDWIVMNPPFHEGAQQSIELGSKCIAAAAACLKPKGELYMVSNRKLPYEQVLHVAFHKIELLHEGDGFKVHKAIK